MAACSLIGPPEHMLDYPQESIELNYLESPPMPPYPSLLAMRCLLHLESIPKRSSTISSKEKWKNTTETLRRSTTKI